MQPMQRTSIPAAHLARRHLNLSTNATPFATRFARRSMNYKNKLLKKFSHMPEIRNIVKQNNLPKFIKKQNNMKMVQKEGAKRKEGNVIKHSKKGSVEWSKEREKTVVRKMD